MTVSATLGGVFLKGVAGSRPAANAVAGGTVYSATDTGVISQSDGSSWSTWATISSGLADPLTTRGDVMVRNASNVTARLGIGGAGTSLSSDGTDVSWGKAPLLAIKAYAAGSDTTLSDVSTNTMTDADATNAAVTFTAPASGNVLVRASCYGAHDGGATGSNYWGLREATSTIATALTTGGVIHYARKTVTFYLTGVSAGSHTYKLAHRATAEHSYMFTGPNYGQLILEVWAA
jgi:hypothetical protein